MPLSIHLVRQAPRVSANILQKSTATTLSSLTRASSSDATSSHDASVKKPTEMPQQNSQDTPKVKKKTQAELDKELELKMQGLAGDGGESGVELEDGQPVSMKRGVRNNMFRYI